MNDKCNSIDVVPAHGRRAQRSARWRTRWRPGLVLFVCIGVATTSLTSCTPTTNRKIGLQTFIDAGASKDTVARIDCIMYRESRYQNAASHQNTNGSYDLGLFQINSIHELRWKQVTGTSYWRDWQNPYLNARVALDLWKVAGLTPWAGGCLL